MGNKPSCRPLDEAVTTCYGAQYGEEPPLPLTLHTLCINAPVAQLLQQQPCFTLSETEMKSEQHGFFHCVDNHELPGHTYFEGYFHARADSEPIESMNPRYGHRMKKPAAPPFVRALLKAFKRKHASVFAGLAANLRLAQQQPDDSFGVIAGLIENDAHFADLAVQVHYGDEVGERNIGWHIDAANSLMHLSLTVRGQRYLCSQRSETAGGQVVEVREKQCVGDSGASSYLASPCFFRHGVIYPQCKFDNRIIAVQCRFLFDSSATEHATVRSVRKTAQWTRLATLIADALKSTGGPLTMPSLEEIQAALNEMSTAASAPAAPVSESAILAEAEQSSVGVSSIATVSAALPHATELVHGDQPAAISTQQTQSCHTG